MKNNYKTILEENEYVYIEKKSKFIANIQNISSEEDVQSFLKHIRKKHRNARHYCYAYVINDNVDIYKISDDGEPSGTAGSPIINVINSKELKDVIVVVTRYFGGILLGTGGLIKAYTNATIGVIETGNIVEKELYVQYELEIEYNLLGKVEYECMVNNFYVEKITYTENVVLCILVKDGYQDIFKKMIKNITNNNLKLIEFESIFCYSDGKSLKKS